MSDAWWYAVWPDPRSRSWALESRKFGHFARLSPPPFITGAGEWTRILKIRAQYLQLIGARFFIFGIVFVPCVTLKLAVSRSRLPVPNGANLFLSLHSIYWSGCVWSSQFSTRLPHVAIHLTLTSLHRCTFTASPKSLDVVWWVTPRVGSRQGRAGGPTI